MDQEFIRNFPNRLIETLKNKSIKSLEEDKENFYNINTYNQLIGYMTGVILGKRRSPAYGWDDPEEILSYGENQWWMGDKGNMLVQINANGFVTLNSQEGKDEWIEYPEDSNISYINVRTDLSFIVPNFLLEEFVKYVENLNFLVLYGVSEEKLSNKRLTVINSSERLYKNGTSEVLSGTSFFTERGKKYTHSWFEQSYIKDLNELGIRYVEMQYRRRIDPEDIVLKKEHYSNILNPSFTKKLLSNITELTVIDPIYNRPIHAEDGLFSVILDFFENYNNYYDYSGRRRI